VPAAAERAFGVLTAGLDVGAPPDGAAPMLTPSVRRRRLWPVVLISSALLLLAMGAVAIGQLYWSSLHGGMARMRASINEASQTQLLLAQQVRAAQVLLLEREAELDRREAELERRGQGDRAADTKGDLAATPVQPADGSIGPGAGPGLDAYLGLDLGPPAMTLNGIDPGRLYGLIASISREIGRLPPEPKRMQRDARRGAQPAPIGKQLLKAQMQVAGGALALGDPVLLDIAAAATQRLLVKTYGRVGSGRVLEIGLQLLELRTALREGARLSR